MALLTKKPSVPGAMGGLLPKANVLQQQKVATQQAIAQKRAAEAALATAKAQQAGGITTPGLNLNNLTTTPSIIGGGSFNSSLPSVTPNSNQPNTSPVSTNLNSNLPVVTDQPSGGSLSATDASTVLPTSGAEQPSPTFQQELTGVFKDFGLDPSQFNFQNQPMTSASQLYEELFNRSGLSQVKQNIEDTNKKILELDNALASEIGAINENPWLTEAARERKIALANEKNDRKKSSLIGFIQLNQGIFDSTREDLRFATQNELQRQSLGRQFQQNVLLKLFDTAEDRLKAKFGKDKYASGAVGEYQFYAEQERNAGRIPMSFNDYQNLDANRKIKIAQAGAAGLTSQQQSATFKLADDYEAASKDYFTITSSYNKILASSQDPSPAGDLSLIFSYMKMLDPTSVVREGEQATAANAAGVPDRIRNLYNKTVTGERLTPSQRKDFVGRAGKLLQSAQNQQQQVIDTFKDRSQRFGVPPELVIRTSNAGTTETPAGAESIASDLNAFNGEAETSRTGLFQSLVGLFS